MGMEVWGGEGVCRVCRCLYGYAKMWRRCMMGCRGEWVVGGKEQEPKGLWKETAVTTTTTTTIAAASRYGTFPGQRRSWAAATTGLSASPPPPTRRHGCCLYILPPPPPRPLLPLSDHLSFLLPFALYVYHLVMISSFLLSFRTYLPVPFLPALSRFFLPFFFFSSFPFSFIPSFPPFFLPFRFSSFPSVLVYITVPSFFSLSFLPPSFLPVCFPPPASILC